MTISNGLQAQGNNWKLDGNNNGSASIFLGTTNNQPLIFKTNNTTRFRIDGAGSFFLNGLGTTGSGFLYTDANGQLFRTVFTGNANQVLLGNGTFGTPTFGSYFTLTSPTQLFTNYKFGVGVPSPTQALEVNGNGVFNGTVTAEGIIITDVAFARKTLFFRNTGMCMDGFDPVAGTKNEICAMTDPLYINSKPSMVQNTFINANNSGFVGIGTTNPAGKLDVNGSSYFRDNLFFTNLDTVPVIDSTITILLRKPDGEIVETSLQKVGQFIETKPAPKCIQNPDADVLNPFWQNGVNKLFTECPKVNVGIGTSSPNAKLHVVGRTLSNSLVLGINNPSQELARFYMKVNSNNDATNRPILIENADRKLLQLNNDGLLYAREIKIDAVAWPDYVFQKNYELKTLEEVKSYIEKNGHLPNVPSAETMEQDGMNVYETNKVLMEKVEELTLYMIQLQEQVKAQQAQINAMQKP